MRTSPAGIEGMPPGVPHIIGNEAAERFSYYGMKAVLVVFMAQYLHLMDGRGVTPMNEAEATAKYHLFNVAVYFTPFFGALLADIFLGKYRTIILLSLVYCIGHAALACMGLFGQSPSWLLAGLVLIALGSGGIKPCVSAHVGDQFGSKNSHLLPQLFNWFYFSINIGAFVSMLITPWLLEWYGPHWAFGVPGALMLLATLVFWIGRHRFVHVPPGGWRFLREAFSREGLTALLKLLPLYAFVAIFWALFDQTGSTWIFQSQDMDRQFLGFEWLPSQVQSLNSVFVLSFIPIFTLVLYPLLNRLWTLTPLRKIGIGLFLTAGSFALVALIQQWIDSGQKPNIGWQVLAFALLTAGEVMVSIVSLEYAYTQAPRTMKSFIMCLYLGAVALGNVLVVGVSHYIQIPDSAATQLEQAVAKLPADWRKDPRTIILPGYDGITGTQDDLIQRLKQGEPLSLEIPGQSTFEKAAAAIETRMKQTGALPDETTGNTLIRSLKDPWDQQITYQIINSSTARIQTPGPDRTPLTPWDMGLLIQRKEPEPDKKPSWTDRLRPEKPWLETRKQQLGIKDPKSTDAANPASPRPAYVGGQSRLQGAADFQFFTWLMLGTAILFIPYALLYRPRTYLQD
jgi:POT family proton-dependent oligopeptide transporter